MGEKARIPVRMIDRRSVTLVSVLGQTQTQLVRRSPLPGVCGLLEGRKRRVSKGWDAAGF